MMSGRLKRREIKGRDEKGGYDGGGRFRNMVAVPAQPALGGHNGPGFLLVFRGFGLFNVRKV